MTCLYWWAYVSETPTTINFWRKRVVIQESKANGDLNFYRPTRQDSFIYRVSAGIGSTGRKSINQNGADQFGRLI
jgi:hypothetical protein